MEIVKLDNVQDIDKLRVSHMKMEKFTRILKTYQLCGLPLCVKLVIVSINRSTRGCEYKQTPLVDLWKSERGNFVINFDEL